MKPSSTESCVKALRVLSQDIQSEDGVANAALAECADRMEKLAELVVKQQDRVKRLEKAGNGLLKALYGDEGKPYSDWICKAHDAELRWTKAKEAKP